MTAQYWSWPPSRSRRTPSTRSKW